MFVAGYGHFLRTAASLQWDEAAVDLSADARAWPELAPSMRDRLERLLAGFCVAEAAVAEEIVPFAHAAEDPDVGACFGVQAVDEARHASFFDRVGREVVGVRGRSARERREALATVLEPGFVELFEVRLPATARALASDGAPGDLAGAVALYTCCSRGSSSPPVRSRSETCSSTPSPLCPACSAGSSSCWATSAGTSASGRACSRSSKPGRRSPLAW